MTLKWYQQAPWQFIVGGIFILAADTLLFSVDEQHTIRPSEDNLLHFIQVSDKAFNPTLAQARLSKMSNAERDALARQFVEQEVLYREALKLGLDHHDYVIKTRLIQKMEYLISDYQSFPQHNSEEDVRTWFADHIEAYRIHPSISFTHIFFSNERGKQEDIRALASSTLQVLETASAGPEIAHLYGEQFYFHRDYVDRQDDFIASHFGPEFVASVFALKTGQWSEPVKSDYGLHLVYVQKIGVSTLPRLEQVAARVYADYQREQRMQSRHKAIDALKQNYRVIE